MAVAGMTRSPISEQERIIGRYQLVAELGDGPFGMLWAAVVTSGVEQGRVVAARPLPEVDAEARRRLRMAGDTAMQLRHPRLVALLDVVDEPRGLTMVSEHVDGELLSVLLRSAAIKQAPLPPAIAIRIALDVLTALRAARDLWTKATPLTGPEPERLLRAVYGGVTPADIVVASYGDTVLSNVGVAGMAALVPALGGHVDCLAYRAPEQLDPTAIVDERADVFSIGVIVWEMLAHRPLFGSPGRYHGVRHNDPVAEAKEVEERVRGAGIPRIDAMARTGPPIPKTVVEIVARALERTPSDRFATLEQMTEALRALSRESIATAEQVVVAIDRLAREAIDARRAALEMAVGYRAVSDSKPPPSNRTTARPPPPQSPERIVSDAHVDLRAETRPGDPRAPALSGEQTKQGFSVEEEAALQRATLKPRVRSRPQRPPAPGRPAGPQPTPALRAAGLGPPALPLRPQAAPKGPPAAAAFPATPAAPAAADPAINAARALFQPKDEDDFSDLPVEAGADGVPPPPPALTRSKPPSAPPPPVAAKSEFEIDTAASGAAISVTTPTAATKNRTVVVAIAATAAVLIVVGILVFARGSPEPAVQTPAAAKASRPAKQQPAQSETVAKEKTPAAAPAPEPTATQPSADAVEATPPAEPAREPEPVTETKPSEPVHRPPAPERAAPAPAKPKPKESFRPRGI